MAKINETNYTVEIIKFYGIELRIRLFNKIKSNKCIEKYNNIPTVIRILDVKLFNSKKNIIIYKKSNSNIIVLTFRCYIILDKHNIVTVHHILSLVIATPITCRDHMILCIL